MFLFQISPNQIFPPISRDSSRIVGANSPKQLAIITKRKGIATRWDKDNTSSRVYASITFIRRRRDEEERAATETLVTDVVADDDDDDESRRYPYIDAPSHPLKVP